jgi:hypothetical protein
MTCLEQIRALYKGLSMEDQLAILGDLIEGGNIDIDRDDAFIDALIPLDKAFDEAYAELLAAADPELDYSDLSRHERATMSTYRYLAMGLDG